MWAVEGLSLALDKAKSFRVIFQSFLSTCFSLHSKATLPYPYSRAAAEKFPGGGQRKKDRKIAKKTEK